MAFPTTPEETLKYYLFKVMSEEDATRFMSLKEVLAACEEQEPKWQAVYALSVHLHVLNSYQARTEFRDYINEQVAEINNAEKLWVIGGKFVPKLSGHESYWFFLFLLYMGQFGIFSNQEKESEEFLQDAISKEMDSKRYPFIGYGKLMAANALIPILMKESNYEAAVGAMIKVAECLPTEDVFTQLDKLTSDWLAYCESIPAEQYINPETGVFPKGSPQKQWAELFDSVSAIAGLCPVVASDVIPDSCTHNSSLRDINRELKDFWAWKFGYVAGKLAPIQNAAESVYYAAAQGVDEHRPDAATVQSLLDSNVGENAFGVWLGLAGESRDEPDTGLSAASPAGQNYWAMRIGFADGTREKTVAIVPQTSAIQKIEKIENIVTSTALRQLKGFEEMKGLLQALIDRQQPSPTDIEESLRTTLTFETFKQLPSDVKDELITAETRFKGKIYLPDARLGFVKAAETSFDYFFKLPLREYCSKNGLGYEDLERIYFGDGKWKSKSLKDWGNGFRALAKSWPKVTAEREPSLNLFIMKSFTSLNPRALDTIGESLTRVWSLRAGAHGGSRYFLESDVPRLKELRAKVLGSDVHHSVIKQMVELFGNKRDTA